MVSSLLGHFGVFCLLKMMKEYQLVKLVNLTAYTVEKNGVEVWEDIRSGYYVLGCYRYGAYFILERNKDIVIVHCLKCSLVISC